MNLPFTLLNSLDVFKKYRPEMETLFQHVKWIDLMSGEVVLTEELMNKEWKPIILEQLPEYINDLQMTFVDHSIHLQSSGKVKRLAFEVSYDIAIETFEFTADSHRVVLALRNEFVKAEKGLINKVLISLIKALFFERISNTIINKTLEKQLGVTFDDGRKKIVIDLELLPQFQKYLEIVVMGKPMIDLVKMEFMGISEKGIQFNFNLLKPPIPSMKDMIGALGL